MIDWRSGLDLMIDHSEDDEQMLVAAQTDLPHAIAMIGFMVAKLRQWSPMNKEQFEKTIQAMWDKSNGGES